MSNSWPSLARSPSRGHTQGAMRNRPAALERLHTGPGTTREEGLEVRPGFQPRDTAELCPPPARFTEREAPQRGSQCSFLGGAWSLVTCSPCGDRAGQGHGPHAERRQAVSVPCECSGRRLTRTQKQRQAGTYGWTVSGSAWFRRGTS